MIRIVIEGKLIHSEEDFHTQIASLLNFPSYYGKNLDALWDCLTDWIISHRGHEVIVEWRDHLENEKILGERCFSLILEQFVNLKEDGKTDVAIELK